MRAVRDTGGVRRRMARRRTAPSRARRRATGGARVQNAGSPGMSSAFRKDVARSIARSLGRFLALAGIVALGCGFYAGLRMTAPDMKLSADLFYDGTALMDVRVLSTLGMTDADLQALAEVEGVDEVMGAYETDAMADIGDERYAVRVHSLSPSALESATDDGVHVTSEDAGYLNRLVLLEGSWPQSAGECVLLGDVVMGTPVRVGDAVALGEGTQDVDEVLATRTYTVVGLVRSPYYATSSSLGVTSLGSGSIQQVMYVPEADFLDGFPYTEAFLTVEGRRRRGGVFRGIRRTCGGGETRHRGPCARARAGACRRPARRCAGAAGRGACRIRTAERRRARPVGRRRRPS